MKKEFEDLLISRYPKIFRKDFGFECDDGWVNIIDNTCHLIQSHINNQRSQKARALRKVRTGETLHQWDREWLAKYPCRQVVFTQMKEKFGMLRAYHDGGDDYVFGVVDAAEEMSSFTCEVCGNLGTMNSSGWIKCLCDKHREERNKRYER